MPKKVSLQITFVSERILVKGNVGYVGENQHRQKVGKFFNISLHAEIHALYKFNKIKGRVNKKLTLYVVRLSSKKDGIYTLGLSKPCINCQKVLYKNNISTIYYTDVINNENVLCKLRAV